jgi:hypothetical protein
MAFRQIANERFLAASLETREGLFATIDSQISVYWATFRY